MVTVPPGARIVVIPATNEFRSGTCASTLFPATRSACTPSAASARATSSPKNSTRVGMPRSIATCATLAAGSMPSTGRPFSTNHCRR